MSHPHLLRSDIIRDAPPRMPDQYELLVPAWLQPRLSFRVYSNGMPVAWARLEKVDHARPRIIDDRVATLTPFRNQATYCLRMIEVNQNYQRRGLGSALIHEIFAYCRLHQIHRLTGEIKGDTAMLEHWYCGLGFRVQGNQIDVLLH